MKNKLLLFLFFALSFGVVRGQTTLSPGDVSIIGFNSDLANRDGHAFVCWVPISAGTIIRFTDNGFKSGLSTTAQNYRNAETTLTWTSSSAMAAGTVITIEGNGVSPDVIASAGTASVVTSSGTSTTTLGLGSNGDQLFAFQGTFPIVQDVNATFTGTLLSGIGWQGVGTFTNWLSTGTPAGNSSYLPSDISSYGLFFASGAVAAEYTGPRTGLTIAQFKTSVNNVANWTTYGTGTGVNGYNTTNFSTATAPAITGNPPNRTICANGNTTFPITATNAVSYQWQLSTDGGTNYTNISNGAPYSGATTSTLTITSATAGMSAYKFKCIATGTVSPAATSNAATLTVSNPTVANSQTNVSCFNGANGTATATVSGGIAPYTYSWSPTGGSASTASGLAAGGYTVTVTDNIGCTATKAYTLTVPTAITATTAQVNISCNGGTNGSATVTPSGGAGSYTYSWSPSGGTGASATGLSAGSYTVTITDANACTATKTFDITAPSAITATTAQVNISCNGGTNGSATVTPSGGAGSYTYSWSPSGGTAASATGLPAGSYTVTITDANACTATKTFNITAPTAITASTSQVNISCNGGTNGSATVTPSGGAGSYTYSWSPSGGTGASATGLSAGSYTVTITDANACTATKTFDITAPTAITASTSQTNVACNGGNTGSGTVTPTGGTAPYTYSWAPTGGTAATASGLPASTYTVTITDANLCSITKNISITQPTAITASTSQTNVACNGGSTGTGTVTPTGGTAPYTYSWAPTGGTAATASGLPASTYTVTIRDANLCSITKNISISQSSPITASTSQVNISCNGGTNGSATVTPSGGAGSYTYSWSPSGGTAASATGLSAGSYTVTITDANACTATKTFNITAPSAITASTSQTNISCNGGTNGSTTVTPTGGTAPYSYVWSPTGGTAASATGLSAGNYTVTVTDANSCSITKNYSLTQPSPLVLLTSNDTNSCSGNNVAISATVTGGTPSYTYSWTPGNLNGASQTVNPTVTTRYIVTATDANSCTKKDTVIVSVGGVLAQSNQVNSTSIDGADTSTNNVLIGNLNFMYNEDCKIIASVKDNPALGTIVGFVNVVDTVPVLNGRPFVSRYYQITPQNNLPASVNLYFTQQDFDDYNVYANAHGFPKLPQNPTDQSGIDTLVISKISNGDFNTGTYSLIHPDSVKWNASLHFWTVSLSVPSFSIFLVHANNINNTPLEVTISSFVAKKEKGTVGLYWTTESEQNNVGFSIERSNDGRNFDAIGKVYSKATDGNSKSTLNYVYTDKTPLNGMNFYRLVQEDRNGTKAYTDVRTVNFDNQSTFSCYPNPTEGQLVLEQTAAADNKLTLRFTDVLGKIVLEKHIDMSVLSQGMYNMTIIDNSGVVYHTRITKK
jgi:hypothetical protein